jgi:hypothetical protein
MKTFHFPGVLSVGVLFLLAAVSAEGRPVYGVRGFGRAAVVGPNRTFVRGPRGAAVAGPNGVAAVRRPYVRPVVPFVPRIPVPVPVPVPVLPRGYVRVVPAGGAVVFYNGYNCTFVGGVYYRPVIYQGATVYVVVN